MRKPTGKLKREMERLLCRLEERKKTSTGARAAEADFLIAVTKGHLKGEKVDVPVPEMKLEDYIDMKWPKDYPEWPTLRGRC